MSHMREGRKGSAPKKRQKRIKPIFSYLNDPLSVESSLGAGKELKKHVSLSKREMMGNVEHSTLLIPAVVVVPSISGVRQSLVCTCSYSARSYLKPIKS